MLSVKGLFKSVVLGAAIITVAGCGGGGGSSSSSDSIAPSIISVSWSNPATPFGGSVPISARISDNIGVASVIATVTAPTGVKTTVTMPNTSGDVFSGTYAVAANTSSSTLSYTIVVTAQDAAGNAATSKSYSIVVPALEIPPPGP